MESREARQFIDQLEAQLGAHIGWRTFATWFASNDGTIREYGVFLGILDDGTLYLEDFDRKPQILGFTIRPRNPVEYVKYSLRIPLGHIRSITRVRKSHAVDTCTTASRVPLCQAGRLAEALLPVVTQVELEDGSCIYLELISHKEFVNALTRAKGE